MRAAGRRAPCRRARCARLRDAETAGPVGADAEHHQRLVDTARGGPDRAASRRRRSGAPAGRSGPRSVSPLSQPLRRDVGATRSWSESDLDALVPRARRRRCRAKVRTSRRGRRRRPSRSCRGRRRPWCRPPDRARQTACRTSAGRLRSADRRGPEECRPALISRRSVANGPSLPSTTARVHQRLTRGRRLRSVLAAIAVASSSSRHSLHVGHRAHVSGTRYDALAGRGRASA